MKKHLSVTIEAEQMEAIQAVEAHHRVNRSQLVRMVLTNLGSGDWCGDDGEEWPELVSALSAIVEKELRRGK